MPPDGLSAAQDVVASNKRIVSNSDSAFAFI
jgi:hypothetical protein